MGSPRRTASLVATDDRRVNRWIEDLRVLVIGGQVEVIVRVGEYLLQNVYGSLEEATSRSPAKSVSIQRLAARTSEFGMTPAGLRRAVAISVQARDLGPALAGQLGVRQHHALLPLKDPAEKKQLAERAVDEGWTADELRRRVRKIHKPHPGGAPRMPAVCRLVTRASRLFEGTPPGDLKVDLDRVPAAECRRMLARVSALRAVLDRVEHLLRDGAARTE
jgi:hypothetical protein